MARRAIAPEGIAFVLLKGTAYAAAGLSCAEGRQIGHDETWCAVAYFVELQTLRRHAAQ